MSILTLKYKTQCVFEKKNQINYSFKKLLQLVSLTLKSLKAMDIAKRLLWENAARSIFSPEWGTEAPTMLWGLTLNRRSLNPPLHCFPLSSFAWRDFVGCFFFGSKWTSFFWGPCVFTFFYLKYILKYRSVFLHCIPLYLFLKMNILKNSNFVLQQVSFIYEN